MFCRQIACVGALVVVTWADLACDESALEVDESLMLMQSNIQIKSVEHSKEMESSIISYPQMLLQKDIDDDLLVDGSGIQKNDSEAKPSGFIKSVFWSRSFDEKWHDPLEFLIAALFVLLITSLPIILHHGQGGVLTQTVLTEALMLFFWLAGGLYLFTHILLFQSRHFGTEIRTLTLVEAVYLFAQILTTVGYGDITPAKPLGQVFIGFFVVFAIMLIANLAHSFMVITYQRIEERMNEMTKAERKPHGPSFSPVLSSMLNFAFWLLVGTLFFHLAIGEDKTVFQAFYMSTITLSTLGFGAFTPATEVGMIFGAFWMIFGVAALGQLIASFTAYMMARKRFEAGHFPKQVDAGDVLRREYADRNGFVDQFGYLRYQLLKSNRLTKEELDAIMNQFDIFDIDRRGVLKADLILHHAGLDMPLEATKFSPIQRID